MILYKRIYKKWKWYTFYDWCYDSYSTKVSKQTLNSEIFDNYRMRHTCINFCVGLRRSFPAQTDPINFIWQENDLFRTPTCFLLDMINKKTRIFENYFVLSSLILEKFLVHSPTQFTNVPQGYEYQIVHKSLLQVLHYGWFLNFGK